MDTPYTALVEQSARAVILIRPIGFGYDPQTAESNGFQQQRTDPDLKQSAAEEFDTLLEALHNCGIRTTVLDPVQRSAPNAVFPNNWFSTHADGSLVLYPMCTPSRRVERDPHFASSLNREGFSVSTSVDISSLEHSGRFLEGTGSLVLDRSHRVAYACLSPRCDADALSTWCEALGYTAMPFTATMDGSFGSDPVYHTNVLMSIGTRFAVVCLEAIPDQTERMLVEERLAITGREVIPISVAQMHSVVGNMLEVRGKVMEDWPPRDNPADFPKDAYLFLSRTAHAALQPFQRLALERHVRLVPVAIPTIEAVGGGSVRCMLAENFLPTK